MRARISVTLVDADGERAPISIYVEVGDTDTVDDLINTYMLRFTDVISELVIGAFENVEITLLPDSQAAPFLLTSPPDMLSDVQEKLLMNFATRFGQSFSISIPTLDETVLTLSGAGKEPDLSNASILALIALMTEDISNGGVDATDMHGEDITRYIDGHQKFTGRKRK